MVVRLYAYIKRLPEISFEDFDRHWGTQHGALLSTLGPIKEGKVIYTQFHVDPKLNAIVSGGGLPVFDYDGIAQFEAETLEEILSLWGSEEYAKVVAPDEANFFHRPSVQVQVGHEVKAWGKPE